MCSVSITRALRQAWADKLQKDLALCGDAAREVKSCKKMPRGISAEWIKTMETHEAALTKLRAAMQDLAENPEADPPQIDNCEEIVRAFKVDIKMLRGNMKTYQKKAGS